MKRNLFAFGALVLAISISSFTVKKTVAVFLVYDGAGTERDISNFGIPPYTTSEPSRHANSGNGKLNWFKVPNATDDETVTTAQFNAAFDALDSAPDNGLLSDESDVTSALDVYNPQP